MCKFTKFSWKLQGAYITTTVVTAEVKPVFGTKQSGNSRWSVKFYALCTRTSRFQFILHWTRRDCIFQISWFLLFLAYPLNRNIKSSVFVFFITALLLNAKITAGGVLRFKIFCIKFNCRSYTHPTDCSIQQLGQNKNKNLLNNNNAEIARFPITTIQSI